MYVEKLLNYFNYSRGYVFVTGHCLVCVCSEYSCLTIHFIARKKAGQEKNMSASYTSPSLPSLFLDTRRINRSKSCRIKIDSSATLRVFSPVLSVEVWTRRHVLRKRRLRVFRCASVSPEDLQYLEGKQVKKTREREKMRGVGNTPDLATSSLPPTNGSFSRVILFMT